MRFLLLLIGIALVALVLQIATADGNLIEVKPKASISVLENQERSQRLNLAHASYVCREGGRQHKRWACWAASSVIRSNGQGWLRREWNETMKLLRPRTDPTVARMIAAGEQVKRESAGSDPWPNCPDPYDGSGGSWQDTKGCESSGYSWFEDPPGFYCGPLQIDPNVWAHVIRRWGVPC